MTDAGSQGIPAAALAKIDEASKQLSSTRRSKLKRKPEGYPQASDVASFSQIEVLPSMHGTKPPGVNALDVSNDGTLIVTGGRDKQVQVYNRTTGKIAAALKGHTKEITSVAFAQSTVGLEHGGSVADTGRPGFVVSASADHSVRVWRSVDEGKSAYALAQTLSDFKGVVSGLAMHPSGDIFAAAARDGTVAVYDVATGSQLLRAETSHGFTSLEVHPDGVLLAAGTAAGRIIVLDVRTLVESAAFDSEAGNAAAVSSLSFSENGYLLASATSTHVEVWDLRKLTRAGTIQMDGDDTGSSTVVRFDPSAQMFAVAAGAAVRVYANKTWELLWQAIEDDAHSANVTAARWLWASGALITASLDRTVRAFAPKAAA